MKSYNEADRIRRQILIRLIQLYLQGNLLEEIDRIPYEMRPKSKDASRCCIYKDRAVLKYRIMAALGAAIEEEIDESKPLSAYAEEALTDSYCATTILSLLDVACDSCVKSSYMITDACRGCLARPCSVSCPKKAIRVINGRAIIDNDLCVNCGKCMKVCPFHAITRVPIPCEEACPVAAISRNSNGKQEINFSRCITCGKCVSSCPFGAVVERSQIIDILKAVDSGKPVIAMVAPAIVGQFPGSLEQLAEAINLLGFTSMTEVASGAETTTRNETREFVERMQEGDHLMTTSCCPAYTELVKKHIPELAPFVSDTLSPMRYSAQTAKALTSDAITVFIGPCIAKRHEAFAAEEVDYVLTFEELGAWLIAKEIEISDLQGIELNRNAAGYARGFATSCGVTAAILEGKDKHLSDSEKAAFPELKPGLIDGLNKKSTKLLSLHAKGKFKENFLEVMACQGGCVAGPRAIGKVELAIKSVKAIAKQSN